MYTVALIAQKGGTGKTTLAVSLAVAAGQVGMTSIIIDLDPQATACNWKDRRKSDGPVVIDAQPGRLAAALAKAEENGVDFAVIDTPARNEQSALAAAKAADLVLIPCRPQAYDLETIPNTKEILTLAGNKPAVASSTPFPPSAIATNRRANFSTACRFRSAPIRSDTAPCSAMRARSDRPPRSTTRKGRGRRKSYKYTSMF